MKNVKIIEKKISNEQKTYFLIGVETAERYGSGMGRSSVRGVRNDERYHPSRVIAPRLYCRTICAGSCIENKHMKNRNQGDSEKYSKTMINLDKSSYE